MGTASTTALRTVLALAFTGGLFVELVMVPMILLNEAQSHRPLAVTGSALLCYLFLAALVMQVCICSVWKLATRVRRGTVFDTASIKYVNIVIGAIAAGSAATFALAAVLAGGDEAPPGIVALIGGGGLLLAGVAIIVWVLRQLLQAATSTELQAQQLRDELGGVI